MCKFVLFEKDKQSNLINLPRNLNVKMQILFNVDIKNETGL